MLTFFSQILGSLIVELCFLPFAARSLKKKVPGGSKSGFFLGPVAHFEVEGGPTCLVWDV